MRQVDVLVEIPAGQRRLRIGIEVRDAATALDLPVVEQLVAKLEKLDIDSACIVSRFGFSAEARNLARENGTELRTLVEVERPSWWLASTIEVLVHTLELVHMEMYFSPDEAVAAGKLLKGVEAADLAIIPSSGPTQPLHTFVTGEGMRAVSPAHHIDLNGSDLIEVDLDLAQLVDASLACRSGHVGMPRSIGAKFKVHHRTESVDLVAFRDSSEVTALAAVSTTMERQLTFVVTNQRDGTRSISMALDDPTARPIKVARR